MTGSDTSGTGFPYRWKGCEELARSWSSDGPILTSPENLQRIREALEQGPIILEHWLFHGGSAPHRRILDDFEEFEAYLREDARAGDAVHIWPWSVLNDQGTVVHGKCPDHDGRVPTQGAY